MEGKNLPEKKIEDILDIGIYSVFTCFPQEKIERTEHLTTKTKIPNDILDDIIEAVSNEIKRSTKYLNATEIQFINEQTKNELVKGLNIKNKSDWEKYSKSIATDYSEQKSSRNAALIMMKFDVEDINCISLLRYDLDDRIKLGDEDIESAKQILSRICTKSAIYPSISTTLKPKDDCVKVYQKSPSNYFVDFIGLDNTTVDLVGKIDRILYKKYKDEKLTLQQLLSELKKLISDNERSTGIDIKKTIRFDIGASNQLKTLIDNIGKSVEVDVVNGKCIINIEDLMLEFKYHKKKYDY